MSDENKTPSDATATPATGKDPWTENESVAPTTSASSSTPISTDAAPEWERNLISRVAFAAISEQRRARRWGIFFKSLGFAYVSIVLFMYMPTESGPLGGGKRHTALIDIEGVIASDESANADSIVSGLRSAFKDENTAGVILRINSPGGSPVQAGYVNDEIYRLKEKHPNVPVYAVISDICASGGYYIAVAADKIYADKGSLVGSIGVLMNGFGFTGTMDLLGVERRLITAGEHKGFLDPFSPLKESDATHMRTVLATAHKQFIDVVKKGRGDRLKDDPDMFSGLIWTGEQGLERGLVDELGSASYVARDVIGEERIVNYTRKPNPFEKFAGTIGATFAKSLISAMQGWTGTLR